MNWDLKTETYCHSSRDQKSKFTVSLDHAASEGPGEGPPGLSPRLVVAGDPWQPLACRRVTDFCFCLRVAPPCAVCPSLSLDRGPTLGQHDLIWVLNYICKDPSQ